MSDLNIPAGSQISVARGHRFLRAMCTTITYLIERVMLGRKFLHFSPVSCRKIAAIRQTRSDTWRFGSNCQRGLDLSRALGRHGITGLGLAGDLNNKEFSCNCVLIAVSSVQIEQTN